MSTRTDTTGIECAPGGTRTHTAATLSRLPLPIGPRGRVGEPTEAGFAMGVNVEMVAPGASESEADNPGSASPCAFTLSRSERLMKSSSAGAEAAA